MSFSDILDWDLAAVAAALDAMARRNTGARGYNTTVQTAPALAPTAWTGEAADQARALAQAHTTHTTHIATQAQSLLSPLQDYLATGQTLKTTAQTLNDEATAHGYRIQPDGAITPTEPQNSLYAKAIAHALADKTTQLLQQDQQLNQTLAQAITNALGTTDPTTQDLTGARSISEEEAQDAAEDSSAASKTYTGADLYGSGGPSQDDVHQKTIGDCWFDAAMAATAYQQPDVIKNAIAYDPNTKSFTVSLYDYPQGYIADNDTTAPASQLKQISVSQADVQTDINHLGASGNELMDNATGTITNHPDAPVWPAVIEAAYAKMEYGSVAAGLPEPDPATGKQGGIAAGTLDAGLMAVTGHSGTNYDPQLITYDQLNSALANHQPITLGTTPAADGGGDGEFTDGIAHSHAYTIENVSHAANGDTMVTVRNPWGTNEGIPGDENTTGGYVTVDLQQLNQDGVTAYFDLGDAPSR